MVKPDIELDSPSVWDAYGTQDISGYDPMIMCTITEWAYKHDFYYNRLASESVEISDSFESTLRLVSRQYWPVGMTQSIAQCILQVPEKGANTVYPAHQ